MKKFEVYEMQANIASGFYGEPRCNTYIRFPDGDWYSMEENYFNKVGYPRLIDELETQFKENNISITEQLLLF